MKRKQNNLLPCCCCFLLLNNLISIFWGDFFTPSNWFFFNASSVPLATFFELLPQLPSSPNCFFGILYWFMGVKQKRPRPSATTFRRRKFVARRIFAATKIPSSYPNICLDPKALTPMIAPNGMVYPQPPDGTNMVLPHPYLPMMLPHQYPIK